jgi:hypothetical protein
VHWGTYLRAWTGSRLIRADGRRWRNSAEREIRRRLGQKVAGGEVRVIEVQ